jgi:hypothetical protein
MTALCGGGASELKPGFGTTTVITMAAIEAALTFLSEGAALALAPAIAGGTWDLTQLCSTDPPADPVLTAADALDVLNFADPSVSLPAVNRARQWFLSWYWYYVCKCSAVATPAMPARSDPGNVGTPNTGLPTAPNQACFSGTVTHDFPKRASAGTDVSDLTGSLLPVAGPGVAHTVTMGSHAGVSTTLYPIPTTPTQVIVSGAQLKLDAPQGAGGTSGIFFLAYTLDDAVHNNRQIVDSKLTTGQPFTIDKGFAPWPSGATHWAIASVRTFDVSSATNETLSASTVVTCAGPPLGQQCCPPDPNVDTRLNQIIGTLNAIWQSLPTPITSYAEGTVHAGLTASGSIVLVDAALAVKVEITTQSPPIGQIAGDPVTFLDAGWLAPIIVGSPMASIPIRHSPQFIPLPSLTEEIGYTLAPGEVISITELLRGP